jgi:hypothetical protein
MIYRAVIKRGHNHPVAIYVYPFITQKDKKVYISQDVIDGPHSS